MRPAATMDESRVHLRPVRRKDRDAFISAMRSSVSLHRPWIIPPTSRDMFNHYLKRVEGNNHAGLLVIDRASSGIAGCININNIIRGSFLSASLGYYATAPFAGRGYMLEGLQLAVEYAFSTLGLHRLEANIQPGNTRSIQLVKRCGFEKEGISSHYLFIEGAWRDHERWTRIDRRTTLHRTP